MHLTDSLPTPSTPALWHSAQLAERIRAKIRQAGDSIPFQMFMQMALYEPGLGYYVAGLHKIGHGGDFVTAPEISPLFSQCIARQCAQVLASLGGGDMGDILELGAGSGQMAADILLYLDSIDCLPRRYLILDLSPDLQQRQRATLAQHAGHLLEKVTWLHTLPQVAINGVILGNEVLDAMPVSLFTKTGDDVAGVSEKTGEVVAVHVEVRQGEFAFCTSHTPVTPPYPATEWPPAYLSEYNPALPDWLVSMSDTLEQGVLLLIDYGYEQADYYRPERSSGTLLCHYQQRVHANPLIWPGLQDITASVDFTAVAAAPETAGFELAGYTTQANFLFNCGLEILFNQALHDHPERQYSLAQQVRLLSLPAEMGERFKAIALSKRFTPALDGFKLGDQRHRL